MADDTVDRILTEGAMEVHGRIAGSSNATMLVTCRLGDDELLAVRTVAGVLGLESPEAR